MEYKYASSSMKLVLASFLIFCGLYTSRAQQESSFQAGEWLKFKLNYLSTDAKNPKTVNFYINKCKFKLYSSKFELFKIHKILIKKI